MQTKKAIRKQILSIRDAISPEIRQQYSNQIAQKLYQLSDFQKAQNVLIYLSFCSEADTFPIVNQCLSTGKKVYCPRVIGDGVMEFYRIHSLSDIQKGYQGIYEPVTEEKFEISSKEAEITKTLMIMPLTVFDSNRSRIGYGKGFYDRYLAGKGSIQTIALAYEEQRIFHIEAEEHDIRPQIIITQERIYV